MGPQKSNHISQINVSQFFFSFVINPAFFFLIIFIITKWFFDWLCLTEGNEYKRNETFNRTTAMSKDTCATHFKTEMQLIQFNSIIVVSLSSRQFWQIKINLYYVFNNASFFLQFLFLFFGFGSAFGFINKIIMQSIEVWINV